MNCIGTLGAICRNPKCPVHGPHRQPAVEVVIHPYGSGKRISIRRAHQSFRMDYDDPEQLHWYAKQLAKVLGCAVVEDDL